MRSNLWKGKEHENYCITTKDVELNDIVNNNKKSKDTKNTVKKGKKRGRSSRRRNAKARAIREAVRSLLSGEIHECEGGKDDFNTDETIVNDPATSNSSCDRNRSLPGAIIRRQEERGNKKRKLTMMKESTSSDPEDAKNKEDDGWDDDDARMLTSQLGFVPGNGISVAARLEDLTNIPSKRTSPVDNNTSETDLSSLHNPNALESQYPYLTRLLLSSYDSSNANVKSITNKNHDECTHNQPNSTLPSSPSLHKSSNTNSAWMQPLVLKLYPLVNRDESSGHKSQTRKFKSRKRGQPDQGLNKNEQTKEGETEIVSNATSTLNKIITNSKTIIEPFPTLYWLTHPHLRTLISQLELSQDNNVRIMEQRLLSNHEDKNNTSTTSESSLSSLTPIQQMENAHRSYGRHRWNLLTDDDKENLIKNLKWDDVLGMERGVAG
eukprot:CAMPEP_0184860166 /NCGR_PEP_ID=MMETSP0580-20130426/5114_1 /TAXON_ID=1118495 /ORGANISM="Dactyliosolen fragilissimus" /LENGTH=436 /DNA_ID=CAMNT_0027357181 /DNA_START=11 /DNA_END=1317 /DNA_ORIENTATION=+